MSWASTCCPTFPSAALIKILLLPVVIDVLLCRCLLSLPGSGRTPRDLLAHRWHDPPQFVGHRLRRTCNFRSLGDESHDFGILARGHDRRTGKVLADLISEGQSDPAVLRDLFEGYIKARQATDISAIERGKETGELAADTNADLVINALFGSLIYRLLLRLPMSEKFGDELIDTVLRGILPRN